MGEMALIFRCRRFVDDPLPRSARPAPRGGRHQRSPPRGISRKRNRRSAAQPARAGRVGLIAGRSADHLNVGCSADRRRWLGAPLAHAREMAARGLTRVFSMPRVGDEPRSSLAPRRPQQQHHQQRSPRTPELHRSPPRGISLKRNCRRRAQVLAAVCTIFKW